ncbi:MAG: EAL domain-containing protein, partial [Lamprobacter sp.]|uniref:EAL domain-containing protein n=1 Tax=Lamprobacter sp. TaxID=3100796 RepID=UPI002B258D3D
ENRIKTSIVSGTLQTCADLGMRVIAEGVETEGEFNTLRALGVKLYQGYLFARPGFESLPEVNWPSPC